MDSFNNKKTFLNRQDATPLPVVDEAWNAIKRQYGHIQLETMKEEEIENLFQAMLESVRLFVKSLKRLYKKSVFF